MGGVFFSRPGGGGFSEVYFKLSQRGHKSERRDGFTGKLEGNPQVWWTKGRTSNWRALLCRAGSFALITLWIRKNGKALVGYRVLTDPTEP